jgi:hypothetical protein
VKFGLEAELNAIQQKVDAYFEERARNKAQHYFWEILH